MSELPIQQGGLRVLSGIVPASSASTYGTHYSYLGVGGYVEVPNIDYRNSIPPDSNMNDEGYSTGRRRYGMMVYVIDEDKLYRLFPFSGGSVVSMETFTGTSELNQVTMLSNNNGWIEVPDLSVLITGGTYFSGNSSIVLYDSTGGTVSITGITTTDIINPGDGRVLVSTGNSENIFVAQSNMVFNGTNLNITGGTFITDSGGSLHSSAIIQFKSTTKGVLLPGMTTSQKNAIVNPTTGLTVYDSTIEDISVYTSSGWTGVIAERDNLQKVTERGNSTNSGLIISGTTYLVGSGSTTGNTFVTSNSANTQTFTIKDNGNILIGTTTDAGYKLDVNGTGRFQSDLLITSPGRLYFTDTVNAYIRASNNRIWLGVSSQEPFVVDAAQNQSVSSLRIGSFVNASTSNGLTVAITKTASGGKASSISIENTLVAAANNDVLVGLDINPTFTNGAFTGLSNLAARIQGNLLIGTSLITGVTSSIQIKTIDSTLSILTTSNTGYTGVNMYNEGNTLVGSFQIGNSSVGIPSLQNNFFFGARTSTGRTIIIRGSNATPSMTVFSTGNVLIQDGGTHTDAGYKLDVNGSTRIVGSGSTTGNTFVTSNSANTQTFTIKDNGNVLIGTTTDAGYKLDVVGADSRFNGVRVGLGAGGVSTNTVVGSDALNANTAGSSITAIGYQALKFTTGSNNTAIGKDAGLNNTTGSDNTYVGYLTGLGSATSIRNTYLGSYAGYTNSSGNDNVALGFNSLFANISGSNNTAVGQSALASNTASNNTAVGYQAGYSNTSGSVDALGYQAGKSNTTGGIIAIGYQAGLSNTTGDLCTAVGYESLKANITGLNNSAFGTRSLFSNITGASNTALGVESLRNNTASNNTAVGYQAGYSNTSGTSITAIGYQALRLSTGNDNTAVGRGSLTSNTTGAANTALGGFSLSQNTTGTNNVAVGVDSLRSNTASNNTALGHQAGYAGVANTTGANNIFIGYQSTGVLATESNRTWIGNSSTTSTWLAGNVLVGTTTDAGYKLNVNGTVKIASTIYLGGNTDIIDPSSNSGFMTIGSNQPIRFTNASSTEFLRIATSGNVLIGRTTDFGYRLDVSGTTRIISTGSTSGSTTLTLQNSTGRTTTEFRSDGVIGISSASTFTTQVTSVISASTTNSGIAIVPNGTGAFTLNIPDGMDTGGGNARGQYAVDLKLGGRTAATQVASGNYSAVIGGDVSTASGVKSLAGGSAFATGTNSVALGGSSTASGSGSVAIGGEQGGGLGATASGRASIAFGLANTATADFSNSLGGLSNSASGSYSSVVGGQSNTSSTSNSSILGGWLNINSGGSYGSIAGGRSNVLSTSSWYTFIGGGWNNGIINGDYSVVVGGFSNSATTQYAAVIGGSTNRSTGLYSLTHGLGNTASSSGSTAIGYYNTASGAYSVAMGSGNTATGQGSVSMGIGNNVPYKWSTAFGATHTIGQESVFVAGLSNIVNGEYSTSMGTANNVSGTAGVAIGRSLTVSGNYGTAFGYISTASGFGSLSVGYYATASGPSSVAIGSTLTAESTYGIALGYQSKATLYGQIAVSSISLGSDFGNSQQSTVVASRLTSSTSGGTITLSLDGTGTTNLIVPNGNSRAWNVVVNTITVCTVVSGGTLTVGDAHAGEYKFLFKRVGGTSTISPITTSSEVADTSMATASYSFSAGTSQQMAITFNAPNTANNSTFKAVAKVALTEVAW